MATARTHRTDQGAQLPKGRHRRSSGSVFPAKIVPGGDGYQQFALTRIGARVGLREMRPSDAAGLTRLYTDLEWVQFLANPMTAEAVSKNLAGYERAAKTRPRTAFDWAICDLHTGAFIGRAHLGIKAVAAAGTNPAQLQASMGFAVLRDEAKHGYATDAARMIVQIAFEEFGVGSLSAARDPNNDVSGRVLHAAFLSDIGTIPVKGKDLDGNETIRQSTQSAISVERYQELRVGNACTTWEVVQPYPVGALAAEAGKNSLTLN